MSPCDWLTEKPKLYTYTKYTAITQQAFTIFGYIVLYCIICVAFLAVDFVWSKIFYNKIVFCESQANQAINFISQIRIADFGGLGLILYAGCECNRMDIGKCFINKENKTYTIKLSEQYEIKLEE